MSLVAIVLLALAMSTDAFAAAIGKGIALHRPRWSAGPSAGPLPTSFRPGTTGSRSASSPCSACA